MMAPTTRARAPLRQLLPLLLVVLLLLVVFAAAPAEARKKAERGSKPRGRDPARDLASGSGLGAYPPLGRIESTHKKAWGYACSVTPDPGSLGSGCRRLFARRLLFG
jgi:hypothetical protein